MQQTITAKNLLELHKIASKVTKKIQYPSVFLLSGDLGSGKTTFAKALAKSLGIKKHITSPTFLIHKNYKFRSHSFHHYDLYRLSDYSELQEIGFDEDVEDYISIIEWPEKIKDLPKILSNNKNIKQIIKINFYHTKNEKHRKLVINE